LGSGGWGLWVGTATLVLRLSGFGCGGCRFKFLVVGFSFRCVVSVLGVRVGIWELGVGGLELGVGG
jgi:hypothetical protein